MQPVGPVLTAHLFPELLTKLLSLLDSLTGTEWEKPTALPGWTVKDIAQHLLGGDIGNLSRRRDGYTVSGSSAPREDLVSLVNRLNDTWTEAGRRMSPRLTRSLLEVTGEEWNEYVASIDLMVLGGPVTWAGFEQTPVWFDMAREYTERWVHQAQIRDAVGRPGIRERHLFAPVLDAFVRALPYACRNINAESGATFQITITGDAGRSWSVVREADSWHLYEGAGSPQATVTIADDDAWRLWTKGLTVEDARQRMHVTGDPQFAKAVLSMVTIIA